jgi:hypothetical protein
MIGEDEKEETKSASSEDVEKIDFVKKYNQLVEEARAIGMVDVRPMTTHFRDRTTGARRCEALESSIRAFRSGLRAEERRENEDAAQPDASEGSDPPAEEETDEMAKTATKRKTTTAKKKPVKAVDKLKELQKDQPTAIFLEFRTKTTKNRGKALLILSENKGKWVAEGDILKAIYGSKSDENRTAMKAVVSGLNWSIEGCPDPETKKATRAKLPYVLETEGVGGETKYRFSTKK